MFGSCWTCSGPHFSNECPNAGAAGQGSRGGAKGAGQTNVTGKSKGKGKQRAPMYGSCWTCGGAHFQADCPQGRSKGTGKSKGNGKFLREVEEEDREEAEEVGGITECRNIRDRRGRAR